MKLVVPALVLSAGLAAFAGEEAVKFTSSRAQKAQETYEKTLERLRKEYEEKVKKAKAEYLKALEGVLKELKKGKDAEEASRVTKTIEGLKREVGDAAKPGKAKAAKVEKLGGYTFTGGSGESIEEAVVIGGAEDSPGAVDAQREWLTKHYPRYKKISQALLDEKGKTYDLIEIQTADGKTKKIYFDITDCFGLPKGF